jgi:hypothetical protein
MKMVLALACLGLRPLPSIKWKKRREKGQQLDACLLRFGCYFHLKGISKNNVHDNNNITYEYYNKFVP